MMTSTTPNTPHPATDDEIAARAEYVSAFPDCWENRYIARIDADRQAIERLTKKCDNSLANNLCPDHRDKQKDKPCLACEIERLTRERDTADTIRIEANREMERVAKLIGFSGPFPPGFLRDAVEKYIRDQLAARDAQIAALVTAAEAVTRQYGTVSSEKMEALRAAAAQIRNAAASDAGTCQDTPTG